jgi:uncharacterized alpha-E superfamily protein
MLSRKSPDVLDQAKCLDIRITHDSNVNSLKTAETAGRLQAQFLRQERVVPELWMNIERNVRRVHGYIVFKKRANTSIHIADNRLGTIPE